MAKMIQIRHVPTAVHRSVKARAAAAGMSLSEYLLAEVEQIAARPTLYEMLERLSRLPPVEVDEAPAKTIRRMRGRI